MPRRCCRRRIAGRPVSSTFEPAGVSVLELEEVVMSLDEFEAVRLADLDGLYQEQAAEQMKVSRTTFGRILESAHRKMADAVVHGKVLRIEGGSVQVAERRCCRVHDADTVIAEDKAPRRGPSAGPPGDCERRRRRRRGTEE